MWFEVGNGGLGHELGGTEELGRCLGSLLGLVELAEWFRRIDDSS